MILNSETMNYMSITSRTCRCGTSALYSRPIIFQLLFILLLETTVKGFDIRCGSLEVQPCNVSHSGFTREGFRCATTKNDNCLERHAWCNMGPDYVRNVRCSDFDNLMFDKCLWMEKTIMGTEYHVNIAQVDWTVAEQYCQNRGLNLVSFGSQHEYDNLISYLQNIPLFAKNLSLQKDIRFQDKLSQRCWAIKKGFGTMNAYWTGLYYDKYSESWNYTDGTRVNTSIFAGSVELGHVLGQYNTAKHTGVIGIIDRNFDFFMGDVQEGNRRVDSLNNRAGIVCESGHNWKWGGGLSDENFGCITGYKCAGSQPKCITGVMFENSGVCNAKLDCPLGDDESDKYCPRFSIPIEDKYRIAHFVPLKRSVNVAKRICQENNWTLPSIHSNEDVEFFRRLPRMFAHSRRSPDFLLSFQNWNSLNWQLLLGVRRGSKTWDDGSPIDYWSKELADPPSDSEVLLAFNANGTGMLTFVYGPINDIYPVCQEMLRNFVPVPVVITVNKAMSISVVFVAWTIHAVACLVLVAFK